MNIGLENVWNSIWKGDAYSAYELRCAKAKQKVDGFGDLLALTNRSLCVDLGCGGGYVSYEISSKYKCKVMGIDFSETAIKVAKETFEKSHTNCSFKKGSATDIPLPDNSADVVLCVGVLEHIEDTTSALSEVRRILKPNGRIVILSSNCYSVMYIDRLIKQFFRIWKYGYQKNWSSQSFERIVKAFDIEIIEKKTIQGFGDFHMKNKIDKVLHTIMPFWGRYFEIVGRSTKNA